MKENTLRNIRCAAIAGLTLAATAALSAEILNINVGNIKYTIPSDKAGDMIYSGGTTLTVLGKEYALDKISGMNVTNGESSENTVIVEYGTSGVSATVDGGIARYVDLEISDAHVSITQSSEVSDKTCGEITYILHGASNNGSFTLTGSYKSTIEFDGLELTNPSGAALNIENGKRIKLSVESGTVNKLTDGAGSQKGALSCKGHLEIKGKGELYVTGNASHAIYAKEYVTLKNATINVTGAVKDGLNCNQYFAMESGKLIISGTGDDGIQVSFKDDTDREDEDTGSITISGGTLDIDVTATAAKALKAEGDVTVSGGSITANVSGGGMWDSSKTKTKASSCFGVDGNMTVSGGTLNLTATGGGGKGISVDGTYDSTGGEINITTSGGVFAYVNGKENQNYTGNTDNLQSDYKSSPKGIKADGAITIGGGTYNIKTTGRGSEGIESKSTLTVNDGTIVANTYDDCINSSSHMYINGGDITVVSTNNDGLDSNGNLYLNGGNVRAFGGSSPECGIDANEESGYSVIFTGGNLLAGGGGNSTPSSSASTQPYLSPNISLKAGDTVTVKSGTTVLATFVIPSNYNSSGSGGGWGGGGRPGGGPGGRSGGVLITCPGLTSGQSYTVQSGTSSTTATATLRSSSGHW